MFQRHWVISNVMLFNNSYTFKVLKNKAILNFKKIVFVGICPLVTYSK